MWLFPKRHYESPDSVRKAAEKCPMPPVKPPKAKSDLERIADALERIANQMEKRPPNTGPR
ncbi:hypothetical protein MnBA_11540 [Marinobacterium sp. BA1]